MIMVNAAGQLTHCAPVRKKFTISEQQRRVSTAFAARIGYDEGAEGEV